MTTETAIETSSSGRGARGAAKPARSSLAACQAERARARRLPGRQPS